MRRKSFCCYSLILTVVIVTAFNIYLLRSLSRSSDGWKNDIPVLFSQLPSDSTMQYRIWKPFGRQHSDDTSSLQDLVQNVVDITIVTQTSVWNLQDLIEMTQRWDGMISVGIFAPGEDIENAIEQIETMRNCHKKIEHLVTFQLVMALSHPPIHYDLSYYVRKAKSHPRICGGYSNENNQKSVKNYANKRVPYPVNVLRNVALGAASTSHVLVIDIDMLPVAKLQRSFQKHFNTIRRENAVYVLPTFELKGGNVIPENKKDLLETWRIGNARPFYENVCWKCQKYTEYDKWKTVDSQELSIAYKVEWQDPWEPFFIAEKTSVHYDERFKQYGFNRISQVCETHFSGHDFFVLDNAFLIHRGFKEKGTFHKSKDAENARNRILFRNFKKELKQKHPESVRRC